MPGVHKHLLLSQGSFPMREFQHSARGLKGGSRTAVTSKMKHFVIIVNGYKSLTIITKRSILDVAAVLDPPLGLAGMPMRC